MSECLRTINCKCEAAHTGEDGCAGNAVDNGAADRPLGTGLRLLIVSVPKRKDDTWLTIHQWRHLAERLNKSDAGFRVARCAIRTPSGT